MDQTSTDHKDHNHNFEEAVIKNDVDIVELNLAKMFGDNGGTCRRKANTKPPPCNKNKQSKRKKYSDPLLDEDDTGMSKPKQIKNKKRLKLPISINLKPLKIIQRSISESPVMATISETVKFETTSPLVRSEQIFSVYPSSGFHPSFHTMRDVIVVKPVVCEAETQKTVRTEIVDLTLDDSEYPSVVENCTEKSVKGKILASNSQTANALARGGLMPISSLVLPAEATLGANLPSETSKVQILRIPDILSHNSTNQTEATQQPPSAPSQVTSSKKSTQKENNSHSLFANLQMLDTTTRMQTSSAQKTWKQNQLQPTLTSIQKSAEYQAKQVNPLKTTLQKSILIPLRQQKEPFTVQHQDNQFSQQQRTIPMQQQTMRTSAATTESFQTILNSFCADTLWIQLFEYFEWAKNVSKTRGTVGDCSTNTVFKLSTLLFRKYSDQVVLEFGSNIIRALLPFDVERLDIAEIFSAVSKKLIENGHQIGIYFALIIVANLIKPCESICTTPFTKKFYNHLTTISDFMEASSRSVPSRPQDAWNADCLKLLETQIQQYHRISNWLHANLNTSSRTHSSEKNGSLNQMLQETISKTTVSSSTIETEPLVKVLSHHLIAPSGEVKLLYPQSRSSQVKQKPVMNIPIGLSIQKKPCITNAEHKNIAQEICRNVAEPLPSLPRDEPETITDYDVVDLTWMGDEDEIVEEIKNCKAFLVKVKTDVDKISSLVREVRSIDLDSGCGSRHFQNDDPGQSQEYSCFCGKKAIFICRCLISVYCGSECQTKDWGAHQNMCKRVRNNKQ